jgi:RNA polymerase sigma factor (sigma-70 family)
MTTPPDAGRAEGLAEQSDADLLLLMSMRREEPCAARAAWEAFYLRHGRYVWVVCRRAYGDLLGGDVDDLVIETFRRAYERAESFNDGGLDDPERLTLRTRAWLGRIAQRLFQTLMRTRRLASVSRLELDHWQNIAPEEEAPRDEKRIRRVRRALEQLTPREQLVLRTTMQWYQPDKANQRMPDDVVADLAGTLDTTAENLRQIRRRALKKLRQMLEQPDTDPQAAAQSPRSDYDWKTLFPTRRNRTARRRRR